MPVSMSLCPIASDPLAQFIGTALIAGPGAIVGMASLVANNRVSGISLSIFNFLGGMGTQNREEEEKEAIGGNNNSSVTRVARYARNPGLRRMLSLPRQAPRTPLSLF